MDLKQYLSAEQDYQMLGLKITIRRLFRPACLVATAICIITFGFQDLAKASEKALQINQSIKPESKEELVKNAKAILLVETLQKTASARPEHFDYKFRVIRTLKGEYKNSQYDMA